ncbi:MAG: tRNA uridine-5-carboxymethylaminomethyl(34) synthesis GTPase MnmE [candidate division WOR-3 bacterium]|nr:tRNA uridine-5-carboxymethylaminomethyl(34) synthesis GTPase MnmE [candidate division WOR-3 bacterium]
MNDTIVACATPTGYSSIAVIRVSGADAINIFKKIFVSSRDISVFQSGHVYHGKIIDPKAGETIDYVLAAVFFAPNSYTGENVVEISCHGNPLIVNKIINTIIEFGARLAQPGEFTKRAFLNEKIDLMQAEAVLDIIYARCDMARKVAIYHLEGKLSQYLEEIRNKIVELLTKIEVSIDFPDEEDGIIDLREVFLEIDKMHREISEILTNAEQGVKINHGYCVVIAGRPNVGKSTLFNRLLGYERAIVHETPGTTRDFIEEKIELEGILIRLVDTAGIFSSGDGPDRIASQRSQELLRSADLILLIFDGSEPLNSQDTYLFDLTKDLNKIFVINKIDLNLVLKESEILSDAIKISAKSGENIELLKKVIRKNLLPDTLREDTLILRQRQIIALKKLIQCLSDIKESMGVEIIAFELHNALEIIGELTGKVLREEILNRIFEEFCIGK